MFLGIFLLLALWFLLFMRSDSDLVKIKRLAQAQGAALTWEKLHVQPSLSERLELAGKIRRRIGQLIELIPPDTLVEFYIKCHCIQSLLDATAATLGVE